jgi:hypothetical protein
VFLKQNGATWLQYLQESNRTEQSESSTMTGHRTLFPVEGSVAYTTQVLTWCNLGINSLRATLPDEIFTGKFAS